MTDESKNVSAVFRTGRATCAVAIFATGVFWILSCFLTPLPGDNAGTRIDLTTSIVRYHSLSIDPYHLNTIDKAYVNGHYYSDKAPGSSLMALPVAFIYNFFRPANPDDPIYLLITTSFVVALPAALLVFMVFNCFLEITKSVNVTFIITLSMFLGTLFLPYSTLFFGHVTGAVISFSAFYIACMSKLSPPLKMLFAGFLCSWLVVVEYPMAIHSVIIGFLLISDKANRKYMFLMFPGILICATVFLAYNKIAFGEYFTLGYFHESWQEFREGHNRGIAGLTYPRLSSLFDILIKPGMGLLFLSPFLIFSIPGATVGMKSDQWKKPAIAALIICITGILVNASHFVPMGGMVPGPRHLVTIIPYLVFLSSFSLEKHKPASVGFFSGLAFFSILTHILLTITDPQTPKGFDVPVTEYSIQHAINNVFRPTWIENLTSINSESSLVLCIVIFFILLSVAYRILNWKRHETNRISFSALIIAIAVSFFSWWGTHTYFSSKDIVKKKYFVAYSYRLLGYDDIAKEGYEDVLRLYPTHALAHFGLAKLASKEGNHLAALEHYRATVEAYPTLSEAQYNLANILYMMGEYEESYSRFATSIETEKMGNVRQIGRAYAGLAAICLKYDMYDKAVMYFNSAISVFPDDPYMDIVREGISEEKRMREAIDK